MSTSLSSWLSTRFVAAFCLVACGCGLSDYQNRMDAQRLRIQELDEIDALLDDPLVIPTMRFGAFPEEVPAWPFNVFLRLPKGFGTSPADKTPYYENFPFFRYAGEDPGYSVFVAAAFIIEPEGKEEMLKFRAKNFRTYLRKAIEDYYLNTTKIKLLLPDKVDERIEPVKRFTAYPEDSRPIAYTYFEYRDTANKKTKEHSVFRVFLVEESGKQICIVEQRPLVGSNEVHDKAFKACLRTLDIGPDVGSKRTQLKKGRA